MTKAEVEATNPPPEKYTSNDLEEKTPSANEEVEIPRSTELPIDEGLPPKRPKVPVPDKPQNRRMSSRHSIVQEICHLFQVFDLEFLYDFYKASLFVQISFILPASYGYDGKSQINFRLKTHENVRSWITKASNFQARRSSTLKVTTATQWHLIPERFLLHNL